MPQAIAWPILSGALAPIFIFFGFAALARGLQELRLSAQSIARVAMRLAEPESMANEGFTTLSQAIRREIATLGEGVEKAYQRASELETLLRAEVAALDRSSSESERRIRSLIAELSDQREAIVTNGERNAAWPSALDVLALPDADGRVLYDKVAGSHALQPLEIAFELPL